MEHFLSGPYYKMLETRRESVFGHNAADGHNEAIKKRVKV